MRVTSKIDLRGPFFEKDPGKTTALNITAMLADMAKELEEDVRQQFQQGEAGRAPIAVVSRDARVSHFIRGRVASLSRKPWYQHLVVSLDTTGLSKAQAIAVQAAGSKVEGRIRAFRRTTSKVRVAKYDLAKGLE